MKYLIYLGNENLIDTIYDYISKNYKDTISELILLLSHKRSCIYINGEGIELKNINLPYKDKSIDIELDIMDKNDININILQFIEGNGEYISNFKITRRKYPKNRELSKELHNLLFKNPKYLKSLTYNEVCKSVEISNKYNLNPIGIQIHNILYKGIREGKIKKYIPDNNKINKMDYKHRQIYLNDCRQKTHKNELRYLKTHPKVTKDMLLYFTNTYIKNIDKDYNNINPYEKHIIVVNNGKEWLRTINDSKANACFISGNNNYCKGILTRHKGINIFIYKNKVYKCYIVPKPDKYVYLDDKTYVKIKLGKLLSSIV